MTVLTVAFDSGSNTYERLLTAFHASVRQNMPEVTFEVLRPEHKERTKGMRWGFYANTVKLWAWRDYVQSCDDELILADCDMLMIRDASHAFDEDFDIAYTKRTGQQRIPINNGIIMVRPTAAAREFIEEWARVNQQMHDDRDFHAKWKKKYPGMNQAAFGYVLEEGQHRAKLHEYGTRVWNAVEPDWSHLSEETVFVHFKGAIRRKLMAGQYPTGAYADVILLWYEYAENVPPLSLKARKIMERSGKRHGRRGHNAKVYSALMKHNRPPAEEGKVVV